MGVDRDLRDLAGRELVGALNFERRGTTLTLRPLASAGEVGAAAIS